MKEDGSCAPLTVMCTHVMTWHCTAADRVQWVESSGATITDTGAGWLDWLASHVVSAIGIIAIGIIRCHIGIIRYHIGIIRYHIGADDSSTCLRFPTICAIR